MINKTKRKSSGTFLVAHWLKKKKNPLANAGGMGLLPINAGEGVEKKESSYTVDGDVNWYRHYGEHNGDSVTN